jgi:hydrophobic/amphiphilic exporter-1 (mainly G- bacteria), HAE1 family
VAVVLAGLVALMRLPVRLLPDVSYPVLVVAVNDADAAPAEVEQGITEPVERSLAGTAGLDELRSVARAGWSLTSLRFAWGTDMDFAALEVRERLDELRDVLPPTAARPVLLRRDPGAAPFMAIAVAGAHAGPDAARDVAPSALATLAETVIKRRLEQLPGVAEAVVLGGARRELRVALDARALDRHGLAVADVAEAIRRENARIAAGSLRRGALQLALTTAGELRSRAELADVRVAPVRGGHTAARVRVGDLGRVLDTLAARQTIAMLDGRDAVAVLLYREAGANTLRAAVHVERVLAELRREYPRLALDVASSQTTFVRAALLNVAQEVVLGGLLAVGVLFCVVRDRRAPSAVAAAVPVAVGGTFALLHAAGASLDVMTLGGVALGVALLMDNSIVVVENVVRYRELGYPPAEAAARGAEEVAAPVVASTLTTIVVLAPLAAAGGVAAALFGALARAATLALAASVVVALVLVPALAARWPRRRVPTAERSANSRGMRLYERTVLLALDHRGWVVGACVALVAGAVAVAATLPRAVLPAVDQGEFRVSLSLPLGTPVERTAARVRELDATLRATRGVARVFARVGEPARADGAGPEGGGAHAAALDVRTDGVEPVERVADRARRALGAPAEALQFDLASRTTALAGVLSADSEGNVEVRVLGEDRATAVSHARRIAKALDRLPQISRIRVDDAGALPELRVLVDRDRAAVYDIAAADVVAAMAGRTRGVPAGSLAGDDGRVPITLVLESPAGQSVAELRATPVRGVPLAAFAALELSSGPAELHRVGGERAVVIVGEAPMSRLGAVAARVRTLTDSLGAPAGLRVEVGGESERIAQSLASLLGAVLLAIALAYLVLAAEFESLVHPVTVLLSVPLALAGAVLALRVAGAGLNAVSLVGCVVLVGVVDNDAVVKVDFILRMRRRGLGVREAVLAAGRARLRPILVNTATALLGLLPMALGVGAGAELQAPLAVALFGGLSVGTLLTLVVVPVAFSLVEDARTRWRRP